MDYLEKLELYCKYTRQMVNVTERMLQTMKSMKKIGIDPHNIESTVPKNPLLAKKVNKLLNDAITLQKQQAEWQVKLDALNMDAEAAVMAR